MEPMSNEDKWRAVLIIYTISYYPVIHSSGSIQLFKMFPLTGRASTARRRPCRGWRSEALPLNQSTPLAVPLHLALWLVGRSPQRRHLVQHGVIRGLAKQGHEQSDAEPSGTLPLEYRIYIKFGAHLQRLTSESKNGSEGSEKAAVCSVSVTAAARTAQKANNLWLFALDFEKNKKNVKPLPKRQFCKKSKTPKHL